MISNATGLNFHTNLSAFHASQCSVLPDPIKGKATLHKRLTHRLAEKVYKTLYMYFAVARTGLAVPKESNYRTSQRMKFNNGFEGKSSSCLPRAKF